MLENKLRHSSTWIQYSFSAIKPLPMYCMKYPVGPVAIMSCEINLVENNILGDMRTKRILTIFIQVHVYFFILQHSCNLNKLISQQNYSL